MTAGALSVPDTTLSKEGRPDLLTRHWTTRKRSRSGSSHPVLHRGERFFPSDAKRYLEACALWQAEAPFDKKGSWGGLTNPFNKKPLIENGQIAAIDGATGTVLGSTPTI